MEDLFCCGDVIFSEWFDGALSVGFEVEGNGLVVVWYYLIE